MLKTRVFAIFLIIVGLGLGYFVNSNSANASHPFKLGLDLNGGTHLVYQADVSKIAASDVDGAMQSLRDVIENRINVFGVAEPLVQTEKATIGGVQVNKLIVELPGVTDVNKAIALIGATPTLDFRTEKASTASSSALDTATSSEDIASLFDVTPLTGQYLQRATLEFDQNNQAMVGLQFNSDGAKLFADITKANIGKRVAIFLDGKPISIPVVQSVITSGQAQISGGNMTPDEAKTLVRNLNYGALPVPIQLIGTQTIGASLGADALNTSVKAGLWGFLLVALFLLLWYRLPGLVAIVSLAMYTAINLTLYKLIPVTLTSAGLAGFILSIGMAVDANILIFERMKEELKKGLALEDAVREGFARAWLSIRDSNLSSIITAIILYTFATSALIKGFALVFLIGVLVSMFTAITVSRTFLKALGFKKKNRFIHFIFSNGLDK
ncbi:MAG: protein translocase subunit SecD [Candidatus Pacebacteria bacterium]|nr:protein translocase subunit SecD [Candidatus Paceibacterota bacterium]